MLDIPTGVASGVSEKGTFTIIAAGSSIFRNGNQVAVCWNNLSIENFNFPS